MLGIGAFGGTGYTKLIYNAKGTVNTDKSGSRAMFGSQIAEVEIGANVTELPAGMFNGNTVMTSIIIPEGVIKIGANIFRGCAAKTIILPNSLETIEGNFTFLGCTNLTELVIPDKVTSIGNNAFVRNTSLRKITFGASMSSFGTTVLRECSALEEIIFKGTIPPAIPEAGFSNTTYPLPVNLVIKVPAASVDTYKTTENWAQYADKIVANTEAPASEPEPTPEPAPAALPETVKKDEQAA